MNESTTNRDVVDFHFSIAVEDLSGAWKLVQEVGDCAWVGQCDSCSLCVISIRGIGGAPAKMWVLIIIIDAPCCFFTLAHRLYRAGHA